MQLNLSLILLLPAVLSAVELAKCSDKQNFYFKFIPVNYATIKPGENTKISGKCFQDIDLALTELDDRFEMKFFAKNKVSWLCSELIILTSGKNPNTHFPTITGSYKSTWNKDGMSEGEIKHIRKVGIRVLMSCEDISSWPASIWMTLKLYLGGIGINPHIPIIGSKVPEYQLAANLDWIKGVTGLEFQRLNVDHFLHVDKHKIKSGTFLAIYRFDGIDSVIHVGSGSRAGHSTLAIWEGEELFVIESQSGPYWPNSGIQKTRWDEWMKWAHNADFNVVLLPLKDEYQSLFDEKKAWEWYYQLEGLTYGYHNFLFGWIDTPNENLPYFLDFDMISIAADLYQMIRPEDISLIFLEAFSKRLGIEATNFGAVWEELYKREISFSELASIVEQEGWEYSNGLNYVCSSFVISVYKKAGLFGDMEINSTEFTPKDVYEIDFFDISGSNIPQGCEDFSPFGYCQVMGKVRMDLGQVSFIKPYSNMNESCPTISPDYERKPGC